MFGMLRPSVRELRFFEGDGWSRFGATVIILSGIAVVVAAIRAQPILVLAAIAALSAAVLEWLLSRVRFVSFQRDPTIRRSVLVLPMVVLGITSLICLLLSVVAK
jgi:uncharacterized membrane protein